ncbi:MAG TPA: BTAD domain-containing putative transcriptional regulator [Chloroflexia bacterium]|nr:BTAD domain-containing putative transcriptional regulator [Chloroflexia bacterium]
MPKLMIRLFGRFSLKYQEREIEGLEARKLREVFCYLLLHWNRSHSREMLADLLWSDNSGLQSRKNLRQVLWQLQTILSNQIDPEDEPILQVETEWVQFNPKASVWLDVALFEQTFNLVQGVPGQELDVEAFQKVHETVQLYQGDLLEGWYEDWCLYERERLHNMYLTMLDKLMDYCEARGNYETGLIYGLRILCHDRTREHTHRRMMRLHYLAGDRTGALRQFNLCQAALAEELNIKPGKRTLTLYEQIREDHMDGTNRAIIEVEPAIEVIIPPLPDMLERLVQLKLSLLDIQSQIQLCLDSMDLVLHFQHNRLLCRP